MELAGLIATTVTLVRGSWWVSLAGSVSGTLLAVDAVINLMGTSGAAQLEAAVMTVAELPLAALAIIAAATAPPRQLRPLHHR